MLKKITVLSLSIGLTLCCAHTPPKNPDFDLYSQSCDDVSGTGVIHSDSFPTVYIEFINHNGLKVEIQDPLGMPLYKLQKDTKIKDFKVENNNILWKKHKLGIRWDELACLLSGKTPKSLITDDFRIINSTFSLKNSELIGACHTITWYYWWIFGEKKIKWCYDIKNQNLGEFIYSKIEIPSVGTLRMDIQND